MAYHRGDIPERHAHVADCMERPRRHVLWSQMADTGRIKPLNAKRSMNDAPQGVCLAQGSSAA
jgi:hypothetical protein